MVVDFYGHSNGSLSVPHINLSYDHDSSESTTRALVYRIRPKWRECADELHITKFTDGITNTLLKVTRKRPGATHDEIENESVLMRAYGNNTDLIIDRDREARSHALLAERGMAPPLFARFNNGLLYQYIPGQPCTPEDLTREQVWRGVARKLAEWHARVPISSVSSDEPQQVNSTNGHTNGCTNSHVRTASELRRLKVRHQRTASESRLPGPNLWTVLQNWVDTLPTTTEKEKAKQKLLQQEIERSFQELDSRDGIGEQGFVFGHLDLLSGNVIMLPRNNDATMSPPDALPITFIDYEYATPCPAVYDIANHLAEWAGFDLDYNRIPTKAVRRAFLCEYLSSYSQYTSIQASEPMLERLEYDLNRWRGIPGLYWGLWALIQAQISQIDFNYAEYAEQRLEEYWAWRAETDGSRVQEGKSMSLREQRWAQEV